MTFNSTGINAHTDWWATTDAQRRVHLDAARDAGCTLVRIDRGAITMRPRKPTSTDDGWDQGKLAAMDLRMNDIAARGMKALVMIGDAPTYMRMAGQKDVAPAFYDAFADIIIEAGRRWKSTLYGIQICNEIDANGWWTGGAKTYAPFLAAVYRRVKAALPNLCIVASGLTHLGLDPNRGDGQRGPLQMLVDAGIRGGNGCDAYALHPYPAPSDLPWDAPLPAKNPYWVLKAMPMALAITGDAPVEVTEIAWPSGVTAAGADNLHRMVTEQAQATNTIGAVNYLSTFPQVRNVFVYDVSMGTNSDTRLNGMNVLTKDQKPKPVLTAIADWNKAHTADPRDERIKTLLAENIGLNKDILAAQASEQVARAELMTVTGKLTNALARLSAVDSAARVLGTSIDNLHQALS